VAFPGWTTQQSLLRHLQRLDGKMVLPQIVETTISVQFKMHPLNGPAVAEKGDDVPA